MSTHREVVQLLAETRETFGKKVRALRRRGIIPARISQKHGSEIFVQLDENQFGAAYRKVGAGGLLFITLGTQSLPVMVEGLKRHPTRSEILHVDLLRVDLQEPVSAQVGVALVGESPLERSGVGFVLRQTDTLTLRGLPEALPRSLEGQLSSLTEVGDRILARDLALPPGVELLSDPETVVAALMWQGAAPEETAAEEAEREAP